MHPIPSLLKAAHPVRIHRSLGSSLPSSIEGERVNILGLRVMARSTGSVWRDHWRTASFWSDGSRCVIGSSPTSDRGVAL
jgi:hypothetical protein